MRFTRNSKKENRKGVSISIWPVFKMAFDIIIKKNTMKLPNVCACVCVCVWERERERNSRVGFPFDFLWTQTQKSVCGGRNQRWPLQPTESVFFSSFGQTAGSPSYSYLTNCGNRFEPFLDGPEIFFFQIERNTKISTTVKRRHIHKVTYSTRLTTHIYIKQILSYF